MASARRRRSTAIGLIVAPRALRQRRAQTAPAEPKCLLRKQFAIGKLLGTSYNVICILLENKMVVFSTFLGRSAYYQYIRKFMRQCQRSQD